MTASTRKNSLNEVGKIARTGKNHCKIQGSWKRLGNFMVHFKEHFERLWESREELELVKIYVF